MSDNIAIAVRNMSKKFKVESDKSKTLKERLVRFGRNNVEYHHVLKDINLDIRKGETVALIGTNGSGKSTLLKLMTKIIFPNQGSITTNGKLTSLLELGAGFHEDFTGRENIYFNASIFGLTRAEIDARIQEIIDFSELGDFIDTPIRTYSSGMYMRLAFSVAINVDADILLIDEILAVGDQHFQDKCYAKLEQLRDAGKTIVIVTHSLGVVKELCHRAIWIYKGEVRLDGDPHYVIDQYLKQVAIDHKEKVQKAIESGAQSFKGAVSVDVPRDFSNMGKEAGEFDVMGWSLSNDANARPKFYVDKKEVTVELTPVARQDVYDIFFDEYAGFLDADRIGWNTKISMEGLELGKHLLRLELVDSNGKILSDKDISFTLE